MSVRRTSGMCSTQVRGSGDACTVVGRAVMSPKPHNGALSVVLQWGAAWDIGWNGCLQQACLRFRPVWRAHHPPLGSGHIGNTSQGLENKIIVAVKNLLHQDGDGSGCILVPVHPLRTVGRRRSCAGASRRRATSRRTCLARTARRYTLTPLRIFINFLAVSTATAASRQ